jgi:bifunctional DNA primase/polymerase-like protein
MMITHPDAYNVILRPYYVHMTAVQDSRNDSIAAAYLLDYIEQSPTICDGWTALKINDLYSVLSPFVANRPVWNALQWLEADGLIETRHDPEKPMNRTKQYRLRESEVQKRIDCWTAKNEVLKNAPLRIIQAVERKQGDSLQNMHNDGESDMSKVYVRDKVLNSNTPIQLNIGSDYKTTMRTIIHMLSCEVFPVLGKHPAPKAIDGSPWEWSRKRLGRPGIQPATFHAWKVATGYGMLPLKGSRLVFLDVDRETFDAELIAAIPRLANTYRQTRGSHCCYAFKLPTELEGRWEIDDTDGEIASIRNYNSYQVGAGSVHPSGEVYQANMQPPIELSDIEAKTLLGLFEARKVSKGKRSTVKQSLTAQPIKHVALPDKMVKRAKTWAEKGIAGALDRLGATNKGAFNKTLYKTACRVAGLARYSGDTTDQLTDKLWAVCEAAGYVRRDGRGQTSATIRSGLTAGKDIEVMLPKDIRDAIGRAG